MALLGAVVAALFLVKVNVGAFAIISVVLACVVSYPVLWRAAVGAARDRGALRR